jgi:hypothetical protein
MIWGQHRGDNLAFQGFSEKNEVGVKALAMGGAYTAMSGDLNSLFYNPAGLADILKLQINISANQYQKMWRENQVYRPNRIWMTLPFYLERLYIPNPKNNGLWDRDIFIDERDSSYFVKQPDLGLDPYGKDAADWEKTASEFLFNNIAVAIPLQLAGKQLVLSAAFSQNYNIQDFDRNQTYLDPHVGYDEYGLAPRVANDTLRFYWYDFMRERTGKIKNLSAAVAYKFNKNIKLGFSIGHFTGETEDQQQIDKVGWFDLVYNNRFRFSYDTLNTVITGASKFSALNMNLGILLTFEKFSFGFNVNLPQTLERRWTYTKEVSDNARSVSDNSSGTDKMKIPATYTIAISFKPIQKFQIAFDFENLPYQNAEFTLANDDSTNRKWIDQSIIRFGIEYQPFKMISLLAGYRNIPATFVPDGAAFRDRGPAADSFTFGFGLTIPYGRLDAAYEIRRLKYYDSYYSNTNYALETFNNLMVGYTIQL